jgi:hypothetical protein
MVPMNTSFDLMMFWLEVIEFSALIFRKIYLFDIDHKGSQLFGWVFSNDPPP